MARGAQKPIRGEDLDREYNELTELAEKAVKRLQGGRGRQSHGRESEAAFQLMRADLRRALEAELLPIRTVRDEELDEPEVQREIAKRALVNLKLAELKRIADEVGLIPEGTIEQLAERIAQAYDFSEEELARLILSRDPEVRPERGITDRVYPIAVGDWTAQRYADFFASTVGHYVRVGIARWFVFDGATVEDSVVRIEGTFRGYRAEATHRRDEFHFETRALDAPVEASLETDRGFLTVRARAVTETNALLHAVEALTPARRIGGLPVAGATHRELMTWDPRTLFMLELLDVAFRMAPINVQNLTALQFEVDEARVDVGERPRPVVRSVRIEGDWVGSSIQACQLLAAGRVLVGASFDIGTRDGWIVPSKIFLRRDHIDLATNVASAPIEDAAAVHDEVLRRIWHWATQPRNEDHLVELVGRIRERAVERGRVDDADILGPGQQISTVREVTTDTDVVA